MKKLAYHRYTAEISPDIKLVSVHEETETKLYICNANEIIKKSKCLALDTCFNFFFTKEKTTTTWPLFLGLQKENIIAFSAILGHLQLLTHGS